ncbi:MAG: ferritin family protein [Candidatus Omnitrophota bacterium]
MGNIFTASEVVELGIQIEKNGRDFYNLVKEKSNSPKAREKFEYLAKQEEAHIQVFKRLLEQTQKYEPAESYPGEYLNYLNAVADEHVFTKEHKGEEVARGIKSDKEAIELAIGFEKDSIILFGVMKGVVSIDEHKIIDQLIKQEQSHLVQLVEIKKNI